MTVPSYDQFVDPLLRFLSEHPEGAATAEAYEGLAQRLKLSDEQLQELLPSGTQPVYKNRIGWAHDRLKRAQLSSSPKRGYWQLTAKGQELASSTTALSAEQIEAITEVDPMSRLRPNEPGFHRDILPSNILTDSVKMALADLRIVPQSPEERLTAAHLELNQSLATDLLEAIGRSSPKFFEVLVLDLLHAMGYGTTRSDLQRVGGSGDGGIDGIISLDRLGLEKVYVQAKRWQNTVGRPEVQAFYGALAGQRANKGVFITTSTFSPQAIDFVRTVERIVLVDGERLAELMIEHGVGVSHRSVRIAKIDTDYFDE
jgi:restriction system protein